MNNTQYTIRSIPNKLDKALRLRARTSGKSLNSVLIESLAKGAGIELKNQTFRDLDWFIGSQKIDKNFADSIEWLDSMPKDIK